jgi:ABC-type methionine transport system ATPase subunit
MKIRAEFTFPGELKEEPLICNICKQFAIVLNIIEASFSTDTGWAILILQAEEPEINKTLAYLKSYGVQIDNVQQLA